MASCSWPSMVKPSNRYQLWSTRQDAPGAVERGLVAAGPVGARLRALDRDRGVRGAVAHGRQLLPVHPGGQGDLGARGGLVQRGLDGAQRGALGAVVGVGAGRRVHVEQRGRGRAAAPRRGRWGAGAATGSPAPGYAAGADRGVPRPRWRPAAPRRAGRTPHFGGSPCGTDDLPPSASGGPGRRATMDNPRWMSVPVERSSAYGSARWWRPPGCGRRRAGLGARGLPIVLVRTTFPRRQRMSMTELRPADVPAGRGAGHSSPGWA